MFLYLEFLISNYGMFIMIKFSGEDFKFLIKSLIKKDRLTMNQLVDSLNDIAWEYSRNEEGHIDKKRL